jgi:hypothetical protein
MLNQNLSILLKQQITMTLTILLTLGNLSALQNSILWPNHTRRKEN